MVSAHTFLVRVELHGVSHDSDLYSRLHEKMGNAKFYRFVLDENHRAYHLPHATYVRYNVTGEVSTSHSVNELAYAVAISVHSDVGCVTACPPVDFKGLRPQ